MLSVFFHALEFFAYHAIISVVDRVSRLPRNSTPPELMRLYRENIALKSQVRALVLELKAIAGKKPKVSMRTRAAQILAYLLTRGATRNSVVTGIFWAPAVFGSTTLTAKGGAYNSDDDMFVAKLSPSGTFL